VKKSTQPTNNILIMITIVPMNISQLAETCIIICRDRCSNSRHPTYSP